MDEPQRLERLAQLAVEVGANVQSGQLVLVMGMLDNAPLVREIARAVYRVGARHVEAEWIDRHLTRALIELGPEESLDYTSPWLLKMVQTLAAEKGAVIQISGDPQPELLSDLPGDRVAKAHLREWIAELDPHGL